MGSGVGSGVGSGWARAVKAEARRDEGAQPEAGVEQQLGDRLRRGRRAGSVRVVGVEVRAIVRMALGVERGPG